MTDYKQVQIKLSDNQLGKLKAAFNAKREVTIQVKKESIGHGTVLMLTERQITKLSKLAADKSARIKFTMTQMKAQDLGETKTMKESKESVPDSIDLTVTPAQAEEIIDNYNKLSELTDFSQAGEGIGSLIMPFIKKVLPKVLATLGLSAASGAISGATHKATSGRGLKRAGGKIRMTRNDLEKTIRLCAACDDNGIKIYDKMVNDLEHQRGGFIGTLLASLAGSLLPALLGGKGLKRAGD